MERLNIAYYSFNDPLDKRSWSGTTYYVGQTLQKNIGNVDFLGPVIVPWWLDKMLRAIAKLTRILFKTRYYTPNNLYLNLYGARYLRRKMKGKKYDLICAPASSAVLAYFKSDIPLIQVHDATFKLLLETYKEFESISMFSRWETFHLEQKALKKGVLSIYSSQWARQSAITDYHISPEKILVLPLGANMDELPSRDIIHLKELNKTLTILFLAVEWERKGGSIAFEALLQLKKISKVAVKLIVCGCIPPANCSDENLEVVPFLNKNLATDNARFVSLLSSVHFLILPTRADCSLLVACESSAYGVPAITTNTGGVPDIVRDGINGYCLPYAAKGDQYAETINQIFSDKHRYSALIDSSRKRFEEELNWDKWAQGLQSILPSILKSGK